MRWIELRLHATTTTLFVQDTYLLLIGQLLEGRQKRDPATAITNRVCVVLRLDPIGYRRVDRMSLQEKPISAFDINLSNADIFMKYIRQSGNYK